MSRLSFRPRPLDIHKKLPIVKSVKDLDSEEGASVSRSALDAGIELVAHPFLLCFHHKFLKCNWSVSNFQCACVLCSHTLWGFLR